MLFFVLFQMFVVVYVGGGMTNTRGKELYLNNFIINILNIALHLDAYKLIFFFNLGVIIGTAQRYIFVRV